MIERNIILPAEEGKDAAPSVEGRSGSFRLSERLKTIEGMVSDHSLLLDIGCDHAYVSIEAVSSGRTRLAYATDVRPGPLRAARKHIRSAGLETSIFTSVCDGIPKDFEEKLPLEEGERRSAVIAGMGGLLVLSILQKAGSLLDGIDEFILSPQSEYAAFRMGLPKLGLAIQDEMMLKEDGKYYVVIRAVHQKNGTAEPLSEVQALFGPKLLEKGGEVWKEYLLRRKMILERILRQIDRQPSGTNDKRRAEVAHELDMIKSLEIN